MPSCNPEHNLCLSEVCNLSFKIFWCAQSQALPAECCQCRGAGELPLCHRNAASSPAATDTACFGFLLRFHGLLFTSSSAVPGERSPERRQPASAGASTGKARWHQPELHTSLWGASPSSSLPATLSLRDCTHLAPERKGKNQEIPWWTLEGAISVTGFVKFSLLFGVKLQRSENKGVMDRLKCLFQFRIYSTAIWYPLCL